MQIPIGTRQAEPPPPRRPDTMPEQQMAAGREAARGCEAEGGRE
jgi:hypothetical protein